MPGVVEEQTFVNRLGEIPVLNDTWTTAWGCYAKIKDINSLTKLTLETAESSMMTAAKMSVPVMTRYQPQIDTLNSYACSKLDELETKYPVIKLPSDQVKDACLEYVEPMVKPAVARVQGVVDESKRKVNCIKSQSTQLVTGARDFGVGTVKGAVNMTLSSPPGRLATRTADGALTFADGLLEKFVPEIPEREQPSDDDGETSSISTTSTSSNASSQDIDEVQEMEEMEPTAERVVVHFKTVSRKLRRRLFQRAMRDFQGARARTEESLGKLHGVVDLIDYAKNNFGDAKGKAEEMWQKITKEETSGEDQAQTASVFAGTLEERIVSLGRVLTHQVRTGVHTLERISQSAGQLAQDQISKSKEYKELVMEFASRENLESLTKSSVEQVRSNLKYLQIKVQQLIDSVQSPEWLAVPIDMDEVELRKGDILDTVGEGLSEGEPSAEVEEPNLVLEPVQEEDMETSVLEEESSKLVQNKIPQPAVNEPAKQVENVQPMTDSPVDQNVDRGTSGNGENLS